MAIQMDEQDVLIFLTHGALGGLGSLGNIQKPKQIGIMAVDVAIETMNRLNELGYRWPKREGESQINTGSMFRPDLISIGSDIAKPQPPPEE